MTKTGVPSFIRWVGRGESETRTQLRGIHVLLASARSPILKKEKDAAGKSCPQIGNTALSTQGNRVKKSCGDEACEEVVVPCGDFAFESEAVFAWSFSYQIEGDVPESGEIGGSVTGADTAFIVAEDHVHHPV